MAELNAFSYRHGSSVLHGLDVRFKLICLVLISLASLKAAAWALFLLTLILMAMIVHMGLPLKSVAETLGYVGILLVFVFFARALSAPGIPIVEFKILSLTREGIYDGAMVCWRLVIVILAGLSFVATTRTSAIKAAVAWLLGPVPFIPAQRTATMMSLTLRFIPVIFEQAKETVDAQRARGVENRKNPIYRLRKLAIPLIRRTFERADKLAVAMEARCYSGNRTDPVLSANRKDWLVLVSVICLCIIIIGI